MTRATTRSDWQRIEHQLPAGFTVTDLGRQSRRYTLAGPATGAVAYARISDDKQDKEGVERQVAMALKMATDDAISLGLPERHVSVVYVDNSLSATKDEVIRPAFDAMMESVADKSVSVIYCQARDRIARRIEQNELLIGLAMTSPDGLLIRSGEGEMQLQDVGGALVSRLLAIAAQYESDLRTRRVRAQHEQRELAGKRINTGHRTYGLEFERDGTGRVVDTEAAVITEIATRLLEGDSLRSVVRDLNARNIPTVNNTTWTATKIRRLLENPAINGKSARGIYNGPTRVGFDILGDACWPAIVDDDTFRAVGALLAENRKNSVVRWGRPPSHLGTGIYRCWCGLAMAAGKHRDYRTRTLYDHYQCSSRVNPDIPNADTHCNQVTEDAVDQLVVRTLLERIAADAEGVKAIVNADDSGRRARVDELLRSRTGLTAQIAEYRDMMFEEAIPFTAKDFRDATALIQPKIEAINAELDRFNSALSQGQRSVAALVAAEADPADYWEQMSLEDQRAVIRALMTVTVGKYSRADANTPIQRVRIEWVAPPS